MRRGIVRLCLSGLTLVVAASGQAVIISTIAGYGGSGYSGDGGPATSASLNGPGDVAVDSSGNLFIADSYNYRIRKVSADGIISTVAGNGISGFSGDGGSATGASFAQPTHVAVDVSGNLFVADSYNQRIRKISPGGIITTFAGTGAQGFSGDGGPAAAATFRFPQALAVDASGNLFIADFLNYRVRKVSPGGTVTTVAGNGTFGLSGDGGLATEAAMTYPSGLAVDRSGNLYIADLQANSVRKVSADGIITTVAGTGVNGFSGDGGLATAAALSSPQAIAVDAQGNLFIADSSNYRIRKVDPHGVITTVAGNGAYGFSGDLGPARAASLNYPTGVVVDASGNLFIADPGNHRIREVSAEASKLAATLSVDPAAGMDAFIAQDDAQTRPLQIAGVPGSMWQVSASTSAGGSWLSVAPQEGQVPAKLSVLISAAGLVPGAYTGSITIKAPEAIPPSITINVRMQVYYAPTTSIQIVNPASGYVSGQNGYGIAQGSQFVIRGYHLGPALPLKADSFPIPLTLAGTSVRIIANGTSYDAPVTSTSFSAVSAILPSIVPMGEGALVVTYNGTAADPIPIQVVKDAFGIFAVTERGAGPGDIRDADGNPVTFGAPAHPGDDVTIRGTGLGPVNGAEADAPLPGNLFMPEVFIGKRPAAVHYAGRSDCCAGLDEIVIQVPADVQGCFVPVAVRTSSTISNFVTLPIAPAGESCSDPVGLSPDLVTKAATDPGVTFGAIEIGPVAILEHLGASFQEELLRRLSSILATTVTRQDLESIIRASHAGRGRTAQLLLRKYAAILRARHIDPAVILKMVGDMSHQGVVADFQTGTIRQDVGAQFAGTLPSPGTCIAGRRSQYESAPSAAAGRRPDAGLSLLLTGPGGAKTIDPTSQGHYQLSLGSDPSGGLADGSYVVSSTGGADVGAFTATLQAGPSLTWTNKADVGFVDRTEPLTVTWSGGPANGYVVFGGSGTSLDGVHGAFTCVEDVRNQTLTVPDFVLGAIPHTSQGSLFLSNHPLQNVFTAPGIDIGIFSDLNSDSRSIGFQ